MALVMAACICLLVGMFSLFAADASAAQSVIDPNIDSDGDGIMNSHDPDDDNDGIPDDIDADPFDPNIPGMAPTPSSIDPDADSDGDGIKNSHDPDDDNDAAPDRSDPEPFNPNDSAGGSTQPESPSGSGSGASSPPRATGSASGSTNSSARAGLVTRLPNTGNGLDSPPTPLSVSIALSAIALVAIGSGVLMLVASRGDRSSPRQ